MIDTIKPGTLLRLDPSYDWHNGYIIDNNGILGETISISKEDIILFLEAEINSFQPDVTRYKCLFGDRFILMRADCLVKVEKEDDRNYYE